MEREGLPGITKADGARLIYGQPVDQIFPVIGHTRGAVVRSTFGD